MAMNPQTLVQLLDQDLAQPPNRKFSPASWATVRKLLEVELQGNLRALHKQSDAILRDVKLSDRGKQDRLATLGTEVLRNFAWLRRELADREKTIARNRQVLFSVQAPGDDPV